MDRLCRFTWLLENGRDRHPEGARQLMEGGDAWRCGAALDEAVVFGESPHNSASARTDSLVIEKDALDAIPTWPWQPGTPRLLVTALALPLGLWIIQYILQLLLGS